MGIETKYEYKYYTVIDTEQWRRGNEEWFGEDGFTWENAINFINHKLKTSKDNSVNNYRVDYAVFCNGICDWRRAQERHKERPVFVQFHEDQPIKIMGEGSLFVLYEEDYAEDEEDAYSTGPDEIVDGLAGLGGRL